MLDPPAYHGVHIHAVSTNTFARHTIEHGGEEGVDALRFLIFDSGIAAGSHPQFRVVLLLVVHQKRHRGRERLERRRGTVTWQAQHGWAQARHRVTKKFIRTHQGWLMTSRHHHRTRSK